MARPRIHAEPMTSAERTKASRIARGARAVEVTALTMADLNYIVLRDGDTSRAAAVARLVTEAMQRYMP